MGKINVDSLKSRISAVKNRPKEAPEPPSEALIVTTADLCTLFEITQQAFSKWTQNATFPKAARISRGKYDFKAVFAWWKAYFLGDKETAASMAAERLKYIKARAEREALNVAETQGNLIPKDKVVNDLALVFTGIKSRILGWSRGLPPKLIGKDEKQMTEVIRVEAFEILTDLSKGIKRVTPKEKAGK